jgi:hypothetical protein
MVRLFPFVVLFAAASTLGCQYFLRKDNYEYQPLKESVLKDARLRLATGSSPPVPLTAEARLALELRANSAADFRRWGHKTMVVLFDTRRPEPSISPDLDPPTYWWGAAYLWAAYAAEHNHRFVYYTRADCAGCDGRPLFAAWCKVAAMLQV